MRKFTVIKILGWFLLLIMTWSLGWFSHQQWSTEPDMEVTISQSLQQQPVLKSKTPFSKTTNIDSFPQRDYLVVMTQLLEQKDFPKTLEYFETLQKTTNDTIVQQASDQIFTHARQLINSAHYRSAEQLLNLYIQNSFRDVKARLLLAEINLIEDNFRSAINKLYEAKGHAYRTAMINHISKRIRNVVENRTKSLQQSDNKDALLELYKHLTRLEPDFAPYFLNLATEQLAHNDTSGARRSLSLVTHDTNVGLQAQALLDKVLRSEQLKTEKTMPIKSVDIPLLRSGDHFLVDAQINDLQQVSLLIDTGASMTILTPDILKNSNISYTNTGKTTLFNTANGQVKAPIYEIESLSLGEWQVSQIEIGVMPLGNKSIFNGLLGMNFLKHFQFFIDQNNSKLRLQTNIEN